MRKRALANGMSTAGFSLVELLVVLLILAILIAITVPSLIASQPERNLAAAGDRFANDINFCRAMAEATGNSVYLGFMFSEDVRQIETYMDFGPGNPVPRSPVNTGTGTSFNVPPNPGVSRSAKEYYIVEERPRWNPDGSSYTYLDWLTAFDLWQDDAEVNRYPVEPLFPYDAVETASSGYLPDPRLGRFNRFAAPLVGSPMDLSDVNSGGDYNTMHISIRPLQGGDWPVGHEMDQARKFFCVADQTEILAMDRNNTTGGERTYDPTGTPSDHPRLNDQVIDYVLLKRVELPEYVYFMNPWKDQWVVGYDLGGRQVQSMQFLQYLWQFSPAGAIAQCDWTYDPEPFNDGTYTGMLHGNISVLESVPTVRPFWMVLEECIDFGANRSPMGNNLPGSRVDLVNNKKANLSSSGRMFTLWTLSGKYYVDEYTPNDSARHLNINDPRLNLDQKVNSSDSSDPLQMRDVRTSTEYSALVAREYGFAQDFLFPENPQF